MKKFLAMMTIALLALGLVGGFGTVLAHRGSILTDNSGPGSLNSDRILEEEMEDEDIVIDNSGPGSLNSGREEEVEDAEELAVLEPEVEIKGAGEFEAKDAEVTYVFSDAFGILVEGIRFHVSVSAATEFEGELMLSDLMAGDIVKVEGMLSATDHHTVLADEVTLGE
ncbi:MAG: hypothetical protein HY443_02025 [Candidatus Nealsonbacteria bacterium]|nr:hypothetical protein [Candidatus Nealsonbacteria bacterium]